MKRFIKNIILVIVSIVLISFVIDWLLSTLLSKTNEFKGEIEVWDNIYSDNLKAEVAIYGSSRAWVQFNSRIIADSTNQNVYNFGIDGHNFQLQYLRHLEFVKHSATPKNIIMSVDLFTLEKRPDLYGLQQFLPFMLWNKNIYQYTKDYSGYRFIDYYFPLVRYWGKRKVIYTVFKDIFRSRKLYRELGYRGMDRVWSKDFDIARESKANYEVKIDKETVLLFEKFIEECKDNNINLIFVYAPEYYYNQSFVLNRQSVFDYFDNVSKKYDIKFFDYSTDTISYDKSNFYNTTHLNNTGADLFSKKLVHDIKPYIQ